MEKHKENFSDDDVVQSVNSGNTRNFEILIDRYSKRIINFIHKMIFDYDEAQSLAQDVFIKVYEGLPNYKSQGNFQAFVFTIAKNLTFNYIKKQKRWVWFSKYADNKTQTVDMFFQTPGSQHEDIEKKQQEELIIDALKTLNENQRLALILKVYLDLPYNRISEITGWSIPKIETLISRAKGNLKDEIRRKNPPLLYEKIPVQHIEEKIESEQKKENNNFDKFAQNNSPNTFPSNTGNNPEKDQEKLQENDPLNVLKMRTI